jgi:MFS family permease
MSPFGEAIAFQFHGSGRFGALPLFLIVPLHTSSHCARPMHAPSTAPWWRQLTGYHWFVLIVASAAWFFDCLDQRLFSLARIPALTALLPDGTPTGDIQVLGKQVTALFLVGWGIGGMIFGALGDRYGRAKMLTITVLMYSVCTGLSFFSRTYWDFAFFRFLTGVGVGGVFGLAVALIAETLPDKARTGALGTLQVLSTVGNISAGLLKMLIDAQRLRATCPKETFFPRMRPCFPKRNGAKTWSWAR